ncbi:MAG: hypothetical protein B6D47_02755 [Rhodocyclaceae bacterium UTPRO2]|nr:MAG: hypothetical protein B6D47_02755 [Rhodocyclaceae bacterium UTPRO2]
MTHPNPRRISRSVARLALALVAAASPGLALAHPGHAEQASFLAGALHPLTGIDHLLAMLAVGLWAAQLRQRAALMLPALFPVAMVAGAALAFAGIALPAVEPVIALSVIVLGAAIVAGLQLPLAAGGAMIALFAVAHGYAHGAELPAGGNVAGYAAGFIGSTICLHLAGLFLGLADQRRRGGQLLRIGGSAIAVSGLALLLA